MREVGRGQCGNERHGEELFWLSAAVLQRPWGSGAKLWMTVGRKVVKGRGERDRERDGCDVIVQLSGGPLRSFTIGFLYCLLRLLRSVPIQ